MLFWDGGFQFMTGTVCAGGMFIEDVSAHEFGHMLGVDHTPTGTATMYAVINYCSQDQRTLDADDVAAIVQKYPRGLPAPRPSQGEARVSSVSQ
jgi:hypothetical protein